VALDKTQGDLRRVMRFSRHQSVTSVMHYDDRRRDVDLDLLHQVAEGSRTPLSCSALPSN
jgi:hypothetical protein